MILRVKRDSVLWTAAQPGDTQYLELFIDRIVSETIIYFASYPILQVNPFYSQFRCGYNLSRDGIRNHRPGTVLTDVLTADQTANRPT
ncbi:hypothetical protein Bca52824_020196 [Brassica carinata]|uniref:Uncharacterized protein n=1 Tax=Brassica carinata TaxID=52824 RepID=A0A8X7VT98_BRACI|nr:hypothetical protein Bca52824_020196 [Brassica carinata]